MLKNCLIFLLLLFTFTPLSSQEQATGFVYNDLNGNSKKDRNETGISGVGVSNGSDVVVTGQDGSYQLQIEHNAVIFVIKPSGYKLPLNSLNQPQFFYFHRPDGSPKLKYAGFAPTGKLPESIDFALIKYDEPEKFNVILMSDPQPFDLTEVKYIDEDFTDEIAGITTAKFGVTLGDITWDKLDYYDELNQIVKKYGTQWYSVLGNHDANLDGKSELETDETFQANFGPATFALNYGKVHFIFFDDVRYPDPRDGRGYVGGLREDQLEFIENDLKYVPKDHLIVLGMHIPIYKERTIGEGFLKESKAALFDLLREYPYTLSLSGHTHTQKHYFFGKEEGWMQEEPHHHFTTGTVSGDWWSGVPDDEGIPDAIMRDGTPNGYSILAFDGSEYTIDFIPVRYSKNLKMKVLTPKVIRSGIQRPGLIYVNFYQGSERSKLHYKIDDGEWRSMSIATEIDRYYSGIITDWDRAEQHFNGKRPSQPIISDHLWKSNLPGTLEPGNYTITVRAMDMYGREFREKITVKVVK